MKLRHFLSFLFSLLIMFLCNLVVTQSFAYTSKVPFKTIGDKQIFGYYTNWDTYERQFQPDNIPIDDLTTVMYAFAQVGNCAQPYATDADPTLCNAGVYAMGKQDYLLYSTDPFSDFNKIPTGYNLAGEPGKGNMSKVINLAHAHNKIAVLSILGYSLSVPFQTAIDDQHRSAFIQSIINFLELVKKDNPTQQGFDGVDVDWEPNDNSWTFMDGPDGTKVLNNYLAFIKELHDALNNYSSTVWLTVALPASPNVINKANQLIPGFWQQISTQVNYMDIMTYDYHGAFDNPAYTNFLAPLKFDDSQPNTVANREIFNITSSIDAYLAAQVPAGKIILGIPTYGRAVQGVGSDLMHNVRIPGAPGLYQTFSSAWNGQWDKTGTYDYYYIHETLLKQPGFSKYYNDSAGNTYAYNPNIDGGVFISYDSLQDIDAKIKFINEKALGGAMFWSLSGDIHKDKEDFSTDSLIYHLTQQFRADKKMNP